MRCAAEFDGIDYRRGQRGIRDEQVGRVWLGCNRTAQSDGGLGPPEAALAAVSGGYRTPTVV
jgi:hypothetical protein